MCKSSTQSFDFSYQLCIYYSFYVPVSIFEIKLTDEMESAENMDLEDIEKTCHNFKWCSQQDTRDKLKYCTGHFRTCQFRGKKTLDLRVAVNTGNQQCYSVQGLSNSGIPPHTGSLRTVVKVSHEAQIDCLWMTEKPFLEAVKHTFMSAFFLCIWRSESNPPKL